MKRAYTLSLKCLIVIFFVLIQCQLVHAGTSCYTATPKITDATENYLTKFYIEDYPEMGLQMNYGSVTDRKVLTTLADKITANCDTKKEKANAIAEWTARNIKYKSFLDGTQTFPIDVFYERTGNCLGYSLFISQLMRSEGIPAVMCAGERGDMKNVLTLENSSSIGHAWVMAYFNGKWHLYDPIYGEYNVTDKTYISKWYFTKDIEGISPYYKGMDTTIIYEGDAIFYINGKFIHYAGGMPASQYYKSNSEGGKNYNGVIAFFSKNRYKNANGGQDGFQYIENPERRNKMVNDECYTNGWISYNGSLYLAQPNGILVTNTIKTFGDKTYFFAFDGSTLVIDAEKAKSYQLIDGYIALKPGEKIKIMPTFAESEREQGRILSWKSETPKTVKVNQKGEITAVSTGIGTILVTSKDSVNDDTHYMACYTQVRVSKKPHRTADYTDAIKKAPKAVTARLTKGDYDSIYTTWSKVSAGGCTVKYKVQYRYGTGDWKLATKGTTKRNYTIKNLSDGKKVTVRITPYTVVNGKKHTGKAKLSSSVYTLMQVSKPTLKKASKGKVKISWKNINGETGYQIYRSTKKTKGFKLQKTVVGSKISTTTLTAKRNKTYYYKVRAYRKIIINNKAYKVYGPWSPVNSYKLR